MCHSAGGSLPASDPIGPVFVHVRPCGICGGPSAIDGFFS
jgi:hypothetical protein